MSRRGRLLGGDLSFKRRDTWISEIDLCLAKGKCVDMITNVNVDHDVRGSDHAPLCVTVSIAVQETASPAELLRRASLLGQCHYTTKTQPRIPKTVPYKTVDMDKVINILQAVPPPTMAASSKNVDVETAV